MPRLIDLFCGAGGAAMGYHRAGFDVVGVDIKPQPNYPFEYIQRNAIGVLQRLVDGGLADGSQGTARHSTHFSKWSALVDFDAIHASPPCQAYANVTRWRGDQADHPELIAPTRELLEATGLPWVMENVRTDALKAHVVLCGTTFGLAIRRHRGFETSWQMDPWVLSCHHRSTDLPFEHKHEREYADRMRCDWMTVKEARQAIPPAYTEWIGAHLMAEVRRRAEIAA